MFLRCDNLSFPWDTLFLYRREEKCHFFSELSVLFSHFLSQLERFVLVRAQRSPLFQHTVLAKNTLHPLGSASTAPVWAREKNEEGRPKGAEGGWEIRRGVRVNSSAFFSVPAEILPPPGMTANARLFSMEFCHTENLKHYQYKMWVLSRTPVLHCVKSRCDTAAFWPWGTSAYTQYENHVWRESACHLSQSGLVFRVSLWRGTWCDVTEWDAEPPTKSHVAVQGAGAVQNKISLL